MIENLLQKCVKPTVYNMVICSGKFLGGGTHVKTYINICIFIPLSCILQHLFLLFTMCTILKVHLDLSFVYTPLLMSFHFFFHLF